MKDSKINPKLDKFNLLKHVYSSIKTKKIIIDELSVKYPNNSRKSIEQLFIQITVRDRKDGDERGAYYATKDCYQKLTND